MIAELKPYPEMKDLGVPWLGEVPTHWKIMPLKRIGRFSGGTGFPITLQGNLNEEILFVKVSDMNKQGNEHRIIGSANTVSWQTAQDLGAQIFPKNTIVFPKVGGALLTNKRRLLARETCIDNNLMACIVTEADNDFAFRVLRWLDLARLAKPGPVPAVSEGEVREIRVAIPSLPEQTAIVRFLDHADRRIRLYIRAKQKLIALLEEQKQAIIHQAVTGQIDVRTGQPYPACKPSGVEWLEDVPAHWERCRLRNVVSEVTTGSRGWSSYASDMGPLFIRVANLSRGSLKLRFDDMVRLNLPQTSEVTRTHIDAGDILVSVTAYIGSVGVAPDDFEEAYVSQHVARCKPLPGSSSRWLGYVLLSEVGQTHGQMSLYGGTKDGLSLDDVKNYPILLPPRCEQDQIVRWIERELVSLAKAGENAKHEIDLLREYRTRLIADVVTGKLDVREAAAELLEEDVPGDAEEPAEECTIESEVTP